MARNLNVSRRGKVITVPNLPVRRVYGVGQDSQVLHNPVHFDGTGDYLYRSNSLPTGLTDGAALTLAFKVDVESMPVAGPVASIYRAGISGNGTISMTVQRNASGNGLVSFSAMGGTLLANFVSKDIGGGKKTCHIVLNGAGNELLLYANGALIHSGNANGQASFAWSEKNDYAIGSAIGGTDGTPTFGTLLFSGDLSFLYVLYNQAIVDPTKFYLDGDVDVFGINPTPHVGFGGTQIAGDWNAGTNLGTGGNFTMNGAVS